MDHRYIEENNLIERYVLGRLPVAEQIRFEEHFAECRECVAELERAEDFGTVLRTVAADDARAAVGAGLTAFLAHWLRGPRAALLLSGLVAIVALPLFWLVPENRRLANDIESLQQPIANAPALLLTLTRDAVTAEPPPVLVASADQPWVALSIEAQPGIETYDAILEGADGRVLWQEEALEPNLWDVLQLTFPAELLPPGDYRLELEGIDGAGRSEPIGTYPFRIAAP